MFERDDTPQRATIYWVLGAVLLSGTFLLRSSPWESDSELHLILETASTMLAVFVGVLALVRFYAKKRETYLFIGTGFLGTALLEVYHIAVSSGLVGSLSVGHLEDMTAWTSIGSQIFLAFFLNLSWLSWYREERGVVDSEPVRESRVYLTALFTTGLILGLLALFPATRAVYPELFVHRPAELIPAALFFIALGGYLYKGSWRNDPFEHWLIIALLLSIASQAVYMPFSARSHDAAYDAAHLIKVISYVAMLSGVMVSVYVIFRREEEAVQHIQTANRTLAHEVAVRRRTEKILQESEGRVRDFLENANDLIQSTAPNGRLRYVNDTWSQTLGYPKDQTVGRPMVEFVHPRDRKRWREALEQVVQGGTTSDLELALVAADGRVIICSGSLNCSFENGSAVATRGIFRDVTEQRRAEREIRKSQANLEALIESTGDTIWSVDENYRLITFNSAFALSVEARTDTNPSAGDTPTDLFRPQAAEWYQEQYERALSGERYSILRSEEFGGEVRHFEFFFNPIIEESDASGVVVFGRDVTRRIHTEEALRLAKEAAEAANQAKSHFLANMSHELRTPLNSIIGFTNILLKNDEMNLTEKQVNFLRRILANGRHLLELINEVLDLAKVEAGRTELDIEPVALDELVQETVAQLEGQVRAQKGEQVQLRYEVPDGIQPLETDRAKVKQVIINLVGNALKFTREGEVAVIVEGGENGGRARSIHVKDTGIGIPDDRIRAIFEAFQQADSSTSREYGGTGLGLTISQSICQMLGYEIDVTSEVGVGSTFSIHLDTDRDDESSAEPEDEEGALVESVSLPLPERSERATRGFQVLVIDDEPDSRVLLAHYLHEFGCETLTASSGEAGLKIARERKPDLITLDLLMPEMDGWKTLRKIKSHPEIRNIPVVVVSVAAQENSGSLLGAVDLVNKPVEREDLLRVLWRNLLRRDGGRVLVVEDDADARAFYRETLEDVDLKVVTAENGAEGLRLVGRESPDAIILDLMMPVMDGITFLQNLREVREFVGIPVIVITAKDVTDKERRTLEQHATSILSKGEHDVKTLLRDYLGTIFHLGDQDAST